MNLMKCPNGHHYDASRFSSCPFCGMEGVNVGPDQTTVPLDVPVSQPGPSVATEPLSTAIPDDDDRTLPVTADMLDGATEKSAPVVGWLVCTEGVNKGTDYRLHQGRNFVGRSSEMDVCILGDNTVSRSSHAIVVYVAPYKMMATAFVYEEMKGRPVMVDDIKPSTDGNGMTLAVDPKKLMGIGSTGGKKPTSHIPAASRAAGAALEGVAGMYAGSSYPLEPNQPVILGRDPAYAKIVFSQGAQKISRRHCEVMFNSQVQKYRVTDFSSNGTYVNGSRLPANSPVLLARGTELALGDNNNIIRLS